jgi:para-aminobenzoate synthetase/4-amino-4-deoxychorismate lyase
LAAVTEPHAAPVAAGLRWPLGTGVPATRLLRSLRHRDGLVALSGRWVEGSRPATTVVAYEPVRLVEDPAELLACLDELPALSVSGRASVGGGWIGVLGYQLARHLEALPGPAREPSWPPGRLGYYEEVLVEDEDGRWWFEALDLARTRDVEKRYEQALEAFERARQGADEPGVYEVGEFRLEPGAKEHARTIEAVKAYIEAGDVFQVNACMHACATFVGDPLELFCQGLERLRPAYGAFMRTREGAICSFSPELFLRVEGRFVRASPIKGTAKRDEAAEAAEAARLALVCSAKDGAENAMIVDLMRNDLGRVCTPGSVSVAALARVEPHPGVWHLVSDVVGELAEGCGRAELLAATFPAGSITGAPKVRAMEIINELEPVGRGAYTGSVVLSSPLCGLSASVAIRTFEVAGDEVRLGVGGGIVADSEVARELEECLTKAQPLLDAIGGRLDVALPAPSAAWATLVPRPAWGVFETMRVDGGQVALLERHLARLGASSEEVFGRRLPEHLRDELAEVASGLDGPHRLRVALRLAGGPLRVELAAEPLSGEPDEPVSLEPVVLPGGLGGHKWLDRRLLAALRPAGLAPFDQLLLVDADGQVLEAERANLFALIDGVLRTPEASGALLPGIARAVVLEEASRLGLEVDVGPLRLGELERASEVFVTNALWGPRRAGRVGSWSLPERTPVTDELARAYTSVALASKAMPGPRPRCNPVVGAPASRAGRRHGGRIVVVDNVDSFTFNLTQALAGLGERCIVVRSTDTSVAEVAELEPAALVLSPGPCSPSEAGVSVEIVRRLSSSVPTLGVCLGHQCIAAAYGARIVAAPAPVHGKTSLVTHDGSALFKGIPASFEAARYHSLVVEEASLPERLVVSARSGAIVMAVRHLDDPVIGVQFHPESFLTKEGTHLLANFLDWARG